MNEQLLYTGLLKGSIIGTLTFANYFASNFAKKIEVGEASPKNKTDIIPPLLELYGDILEDREEKELELLLQSSDNELIKKELRKLENRYLIHFLYLLSERRKKVEIVYQDVTNRVNIVINDLIITDIKRVESLNNENLNTIELVVVLLKKIENEESQSITHLYKETYDSVVRHVENRGGDKDNATDIWLTASSEFKRKLDKFPIEKGYYTWEGSKDKKDNKASIKSFFILICMKRWLDNLRSSNVQNRNQENAEDNFYASFDNDELNSFYEKEGLKVKIRTAISKLDDLGRTIITGRFFNPNYDDVLTSKELAQETGYSVGTINNNYQSCLAKLREILKEM